MKKKLVTALFALSCLTTVGAIATAEANPLKPGEQVFTKAMVVGKTMASSGYPGGTMTFNSNGTLTCVNYPAVINCKSWQIDPDGRLHREFIDSHTGTPVEVRAYWKLLANNGATLQVSQTSNNSPGETTLTVSYR
ncbi:MAG: hypothetical protein FIA89_07115 [Geobacter sp.]|nr:hypothetical protein [Geobacter sp.]